MRRSIKKVDSRGIAIKGKLKNWKAAHPDEQHFDSKLEWSIWKYLVINNIVFINQPNILLYPAIKTEELKSGVVKTTAQRKMTYTPDFLLVKDNVYIEVKGWATPEFRLRWKLFKLNSHKGLIVKTISDLQVVLKYLNYDISKHKIPK